MTDLEKTMSPEQLEMIRARYAAMRHEQEKKLNNFRTQNLYIQKGQTLFTGSSLMEGFPITEFCVSEGLPIAYNRGIGGYTTDDFLEAIDVVLLDPAPKKLFLNIGTNDIRQWQKGEDWYEHLSRNERAICEIIRDRLPDTEVYLMAFYPVNPNASRAKGNLALIVRTNEAVERANRMVESLAQEYGFHYIDVNDGLKDEDGNLKIGYTEDGIHFDAAGYRTVFERLRQYL
ncbi:MAG: hypothetical protein IJ083_12525 [Clostridia bacterium]|nr:hypothetical protein [Clostridia bacterium]